MPVQTADAAEYTDLLDAADDKDDFEKETYDPFDFNIEPSFRYDTSSAQISREAPCVPNPGAYAGEPAVANNPRLVREPGRCSSPSLVYNREMDYEFSQSTFNLALRAGIYKDLELRIDVPYVVNSSAGLKYAEGVTAANSSVDPSNGRVSERAAQVFTPGDADANIRQFDLFNMYRYFDLANEATTYERSGFADPSIGLFWAPYNDRRDDTKATLLLGMEYTMPIAPIKRVDNDAVGQGMHVLHWKVASSKQFDWINPYFGLEYFLPLLASDSPLRQSYPGNDGQVIDNAPMRGDITVGTEFIPYENVLTGERYAIDLRFTMGYVSEGRDYTPLYDHLANSQCNGKTLGQVLPQFDASGNLTNPNDVACAWIVQRPANADLNPAYDLTNTSHDTPFRTDALMTVEDYGTFAGQLGFYLQPSKYFQLNALVRLKHRQEHFLTNARTGRDADDSQEETADETVDLTGADAAFERSPVYNPTIDSAGNRFRIQEYNTWSFVINAALQF
jgi:hypothetical protein